jgi:hypothetical protein
MVVRLGCGRARMHVRADEATSSCVCVSVCVSNRTYRLFMFCQFDFSEAPNAKGLEELIVSDAGQCRHGDRAGAPAAAAMAANADSATGATGAKSAARGWGIGSRARARVSGREGNSRTTKRTVVFQLLDFSRVK